MPANGSFLFARILHQCNQSDTWNGGRVEDGGDIDIGVGKGIISGIFLDGIIPEVSLLHSQYDCH